LRDVIGRFLLSSFQCPSMELEPLPKYVEYVLVCVRIHQGRTAGGSSSSDIK
jgi:hypothetical protein